MLQLRQRQSQRPPAPLVTSQQHQPSYSCQSYKWRYKRDRCGCGRGTSRTGTNWTCRESYRTASFQRCLHTQQPYTHATVYTQNNKLIILQVVISKQSVEKQLVCRVGHYTILNPAAAFTESLYCNFHNLQKTHTAWSPLLDFMLDIKQHWRDVQSKISQAAQCSRRFLMLHPV